MEASDFVSRVMAPRQEAFERRYAPKAQGFMVDDIANQAPDWPGLAAGRLARPGDTKTGYGPQSFVLLGGSGNWCAAVHAGSPPGNVIGRRPQVGAASCGHSKRE